MPCTTVRECSALGVIDDDVRQKMSEGEAMHSALSSERYLSRWIAYLDWTGSLVGKRRSPKELSRTPEPPSSTRLHSAFKSGGLLSDVGGTAKREVLHEVSARMILPSNFDRTTFSNALVNPLASGPVGMGDGFAVSNIIHSEFIVPDRTSLTLCCLNQPVDFGTTDGHPVHTLLVLFSNNRKNHLTTLAALATALQCDRFRSILRDKPSEEIVLQEFLRFGQQ